jgi:D-beta-D-heptose 7-phosphate kinase/D-beta-D-heptose 1-phosphate adenosyltransferase
VAHNVAALGGRPFLVGVTGDDDAGMLLRREMEGRGLSCEGLVTDPGRPTSIKTRIVARHQQVVRADQESREEVPEAVSRLLRERCLEGGAPAEACVISDYGKGAITRPLLETLLPAFKRSGVAVCVDPKETHFHDYRSVSVITPNLLEAGMAWGRRIRTDADLDLAGRALREALDCDVVMITRGEQGMSLFERGMPRIDLPTVAREVYDVTGAGDTVVSVYSVALAAGASPREAACLANHAAGIVVREVGTATAAPAQILASLRDGEGP